MNLIVMTEPGHLSQLFIGLLYQVWDLLSTVFDNIFVVFLQQLVGQVLVLFLNLVQRFVG